MLQPFVENAVIHGIRETENAVILLSARRVDERHVKIVISDNGCGMDAQTLACVQAILFRPGEHQTGGIGLRNVAERIYAFFGSETVITASSMPGKGTSITLHLPWPAAAEGITDNHEEDEDEVY